MGNQTYKQILSFGIDYPYKGKDSFVFSRTPQSQDENVTFVTEAPESFAKKLKEVPGKDIWLNGGAKLFASFFEKDLVDELILFVIPITIGTGIPLFSKTSFESKLELLTTDHYSEGHADGIVKLHYKLIR